MVDWNNFANALVGFGAGVQGQGPQFLQQMQENEARNKLAQLGADREAGKIDQAQYLKGLAASNPEIYGKLALSQMGVDQPADVKSWLYRSGLPSEQQAAFDSFRRAPQWLNTGGAFVNPTTNAAITVTPKPEEMPAFKREQAAATAGGSIEGEKTAEAKTGLGDFLATAKNQLSVIDQMVGNKEKGVNPHPGLSAAVGGLDARFPSVMDDTVDFENLLDQAKGGAFLDSITALQGYGALSNQEGSAATNAITRMKAASSEEGFIKAAKEYRKYVSEGIARMKKKAGVDAPTPNGKQSESEKVVREVEQMAQTMPKDKSGLKINTLYKTPRGIALWDGEKFIQE